ncbi:hypothetical protein CBS101457_005187 [Exobasidium rhododendri]|nr:hypothetical protein CBS101457_005187 [Exobasidium rhododendri]
MTSPVSPTSPAVPGSFSVRSQSAIRGAIGEAGPSRQSSDPTNSGAATENFSRPDGQRANHSYKMARSGSDDTRKDDRIKSRAVNDLGWNWEAERARLEGSSSVSRTTSGTLYGVEETGSGLYPSSAGMGSSSGGLVANNYGSGLTVSDGRPVDAIRPPLSPRISSKNPPRINTSSANGSGSGISQSAGYHPTHSSAPSQPVSATATTFPPMDRSLVTTSKDSSMSKQVQVRPPQHQSSTSSQQKEKGRRDQSCDACGKPMTGQFVRALGVVFHLDCFRCQDCNKVVAAKFFPATDDMSSSPAGSSGSHEGGKQVSPTTMGSGKLFPLCETDYFRRLDLICANCGGALRGSYITALGKKFHVEHFTCSICPTVFGPQDSYYEHDQRVFCHFHYSTRFAIRCTGCQTAILKQFVEINRNNQDEHWHPECYMIHKFWNIKLYPTGTATPRENVAVEPTTVPSAPEPSISGVAPVSNASATDAPTAEALEIEANETPSTLKQKQKQMEEQVYRIWTVLSAFEESSAACISEMLRHVSSGRYLGGVRMAERFILHVEILFSAIDDLEGAFKAEKVKGISHIREARMLCKKVVNFFSLLSHTQETGAQRMGITQELLSLVTGLAHYLKILIRIALTGALRLDRDFKNHEAIGIFLNKLACLAKEANMVGEDKLPTSPSLIVAPEPGSGANGSTTASSSGSHEEVYGYKSLPRRTTSAISEGGEGATDLCVSCGQTVEEECTRMGVNMRWHTSCLKCRMCKRPAYKESTSSKTKEQNLVVDPSIPPPLPADQFALDVVRRSMDPTKSTTNGSSTRYMQGFSYLPYCPDCKTTNCRMGFENVTRLEQYAFLLRVALNRLYALLKKRGVVPASPPTSSAEVLSSSDTNTGLFTAVGTEKEKASGDDAYRHESQDIKRKKSVNLDRKLSTKAKVPHISAVVGSPSGQITQSASIQKTTTTSPIEAQLQRSPSPQKNGENDGDSRGGRRQNSGDVPGSTSSSRVYPNPTNALGWHQSPFQQQQQSTQQQQQQRQQAMQYTGTQQGPIIPIRPAFARHNTDVQIQDQGPIRQASGDDELSQGVISEPEDGLTLADIPHLLEAEQAREQHRSLPSTEGRSLSELSALELFIVKHMAVMMLQQSALKEFVPFDDLIDFIEMRKNTFWGKLFKGGKDKKKIEKKGIFGIPLEILVERSGADSTLGASATHLRVPSFIDEIISAMKQMDVSIEGIFRKNGNIRRLKELSEALDRDSASVNLSDDNPVQLAALLKKWLRELPDPLLTYKLHRLFVMSQKLETEEERNRCLHLIIVLLPKAHRDTMEVLFVFLKWVASFSHIDEETGSKMDLQNLAMVLGPNILYSKGTDPAKDELFLANRAILALLEHQDDFWLLPEELEIVLQDRELLNSTNELTSRDILRRCEKHAKRARSSTLPTTKAAFTAQQLQQGGNGRWQEAPGNRHLPDMHGPATVRQVYGGGIEGNNSFGNLYNINSSNQNGNNASMRQLNQHQNSGQSQGILPRLPTGEFLSEQQRNINYHEQQQQTPSGY